MARVDAFPVLDRLAARRADARHRGPAAASHGGATVRSSPTSTSAGSPTTAGTRSSSTAVATPTSTNLGFDLMGGERFRSPGSSPSSRPDGTRRQVADGSPSPTGWSVTPDDSTLIVADSYAGQADRVRHRRRRRRSPAAGSGPTSARAARTGSAWTPRAPSGTRTSQDAACASREGGEVLDDGRARPRLLRLHARRRGRQDAVPERRRMERPGGHLQGAEDRPGARR